MRYVDVIHCNPRCRVVRNEETKRYSVDLTDANRGMVGYSVDVMRLVLASKYPADRIPLRLVPTLVGPLSFQLTFEVRWGNGEEKNLLLVR